MVRLGTLTALALVLGFPGTAHCETIRLTVAGDVASPETYELDVPPDTPPISLRDLLQKAGASGEGRAVLLRGDRRQPTRRLVPVSIDFISGTSSTYNASLHKTPLASGDIVIFRRTDSAPPQQPHVVLMLNDGIPRIAPLDGIGSSTGQILSMLQATATSGVAIPVMRTERGQCRSLGLSLSDPLQHADVVQMSSVASVRRERISELWAAGNTVAAPAQPVAMQTVNVPVHTAALESDTSAILGPAADSEPVLMLPSENPSAPAVEEAVPVTTLPSAADNPTDQVSSSAELEAAMLATQDPFASPPTDVSAAWYVVLGLGLLGSLAMIASGLYRTRMERREAAARQLASSSKTPPQKHAPQPVQAVAVTGQPAPMMSGTTRFSVTTDSMPELPAEDSSASVAVTVEPTDGVFQEPQFAWPAEDRVVSRPPAELQAEYQDIIGPPQEKTPGKTLVQEHEWYADNWRQEPAVTAQPAAAMQMEQPQAAEKAAPQQADELIPEETSDLPVMQATDLTPPRESGTTPDALHMRDDTDSPVMLPVENQNEASLDDGLEDLIQNRLPIDLQQADLPLQVTMFGQPAGPRRLRIDAAHQELAAPHFAARSRQRQQSIPAVAAEAAAPPPPVQDTPGELRRSDAASLDRALNSLHGQNQGQRH